MKELLALALEYGSSLMDDNMKGRSKEKKGCNKKKIYCWIVFGEACTNMHERT